ncbi:MAG: PDZ domain-containing protein [Lachnospiraceae bacterium]|nr:PDZ domain-containing protein [Lachnospiraceae bacterium]
MSGSNKDKKFFHNVLGASIFAILGTAAVCSVYYFTAGSDSKITEIMGNNKYQFEATKVTSGNIEAATDISDVVDKVMPSVVSITQKTKTMVYDNWFGFGSEQENVGSGSGIIIEEDEENYYVATNNHVVDGADTIEVTFIDDKVVKAEIKGKQASDDLAILAISKKKVTDVTKKSIKVATIGNSDKVRVGEQVIAIGNALGYGQSVTGGYVSAKDRELEFAEGTMTAIQTDAAINPGNSGGALINLYGEVVGINSAKLASEEVEGMGYAIPISKAQPILDKLIKRETISEEDKGYLGIQVRNIASDEKEMFNYPDGVYVDSVGKDGAAHKAGIITGDIIYKVNGQEVNSADALVNEVGNYKKGEKIKIKLKRVNEGRFESYTFDVTLAAQVSEETEEPKFN